MKREKISECPNELQELIESVNLLPKDWENFEQDSRRLVEQWRIEIYKPISEEENALSNLLSKYGKKKKINNEVKNDNYKRETRCSRERKRVKSKY